MQTQIRHRNMRCLIRIFTVCLRNVLLKFCCKNTTNTPKIGNGLVPLRLTRPTKISQFVRFCYFTHISATKPQTSLRNRAVLSDASLKYTFLLAGGYQFFYGPYTVCCVYGSLSLSLLRSRGGMACLLLP